MKNVSVSCTNASVRLKVSQYSFVSENSRLLIICFSARILHLNSFRMLILLISWC